MGEACASGRSHGLVRVRVLGRTDYMDPREIELVDELPDYLRGAGFEPDLYFHEPGGCGPAPLADLVLYLEPHVVSGVIGGAAWAAIAGVAGWARRFMARGARGPESRDLCVNLNVYSGEGAHISHCVIRLDGIEELFCHPAVSDYKDSSDLSVVELNPQGMLAVVNPHGSLSCLVKRGWVGCETPCENWPIRSDGTIPHGVTFDSAGSIEWIDGQIGNMERIVIGRRRGRALGWTIHGEGEAIVFVNDETGCVISVSPHAVEVVDD